MVQDIFANELNQWKNNGARIIDVREPHEYIGGHIPDAENIPMNTIPELLDTLEGPLVLVCASGGRSANVGHFLVAQGKTQVANLLGGTYGWAASGLDIEQ